MPVRPGATCRSSSASCWSSCPIGLRLLQVEPRGTERAALVLFLGIALYACKIVHDPLLAGGYDEYLHLRTAQDIMTSHGLFQPNSMLTVSPYYPGMELVSTAIAQMTGIGVYESGIIVLAAARLVFVLSLFFFFAMATGSARVAGIAALIYMTNSRFLYFDSQFAYESLALPLAAAVLYMLSRRGHSGPARWLGLTVIAVVTIAAVVTTHHVTSMMLSIFLLLWGSVALDCAAPRPVASRTDGAAVHGADRRLDVDRGDGDDRLPRPIPHLVLRGAAQAHRRRPRRPRAVRLARRRRRAVVGAPCRQRVRRHHPDPAAARPAGRVVPLPVRAARADARARGDVLPTHPRRALHPHRRRGGLADPGDRVHRHRAGRRPRTRPIDLWRPIWTLSRWQPPAWSLAVLAVGGVLVGMPSWARLPGPYMVSADRRSIDGESVSASAWSRAALGTSNNFVADRVNRVLLATIGGQDVVVTYQSGVPVRQLYLSRTIGERERRIVTNGDVEYLLVDRRLTTGLPVVGQYFDRGEEAVVGVRTTPLDPALLDKFDTTPDISRVFDSGDIQIYDMRGAAGEPVATRSVLKRAQQPARLRDPGRSKKWHHFPVRVPRSAPAGVHVADQGARPLRDGPRLRQLPRLLTFMRDGARYLALYDGARSDQLTGEASTWYLFSKDAAANIKASNPETKVIAMLREPVAMLTSLHLRRMYGGSEDIKDFAEALAAEADRREGRRLSPRARNVKALQYREVGRYAEQIERYLDAFGPGRSRS